MKNQAIEGTLGYFFPDLLGCEFENTPARKLIDMKVIKECDSTLVGQHWPGTQKNVYSWCILENGKAVGWNESPSHGWSFPVVKYSYPQKSI